MVGSNFYQTKENSTAILSVSANSIYTAHNAHLTFRAFISQQKEIFDHIHSHSFKHASRFLSLLSLRGGGGRLLGLVHHRVVHLGLLGDHLRQHGGASLRVVDHRVVSKVLPLHEPVMRRMQVCQLPVSKQVKSRSAIHRTSMRLTRRCCRQSRQTKPSFARHRTECSVSRGKYGTLPRPARHLR